MIKRIVLTAVLVIIALAPAETAQARPGLPSFGTTYWSDGSPGYNVKIIQFDGSRVRMAEPLIDGVPFPACYEGVLRRGRTFFGTGYFRPPMRAKTAVRMYFEDRKQRVHFRYYFADGGKFYTSYYVRTGKHEAVRTVRKWGYSVRVLFNSCRAR